MESDEKQATEAIAQRPYRAAVDADWQRCRQLGIRAVPTFKINEALLVGAQPYAALLRLAASCSVPLRAKQS